MCNLNATTSNFASQVAAATADQVICVASGNYGTWTGTNKAIAVTKQSGATVTMGIDLTTGNNGFTIDGLTIPGGRIIKGAKISPSRTRLSRPTIHCNGESLLQSIRARSVQQRQ
jgi:hypothetical protein